MRTAVIYDKWLHQFGGAEMVACSMADALIKKGWEVTFISGKYVHFHKIKDKFGIDLGNIPFYQVWNHENHLKRLVEGKDLFVNLSFMDYSYGYAKKNLYYTHFPTAIRNIMFNLPLEFFHITGLHVLMPQPLRERIYNRIRAGIFFDMKKRLTSYDIILANSGFTKKWINRYWGMGSEILYPPVPVLVDKITSPENKRNWICSLGRFFTLGHGKKQEVMVEAFKKLHDHGLKDWELHMVGGVGDEPSSLRFIEQLKEMAKGYPIFFHLNVPQEEIKKVLSQSRIYWHATGYSEDEEKNPMGFEHFGIAPVEAVASGCLPIFYNGGGLKETVAMLGLPEEKHLFNTIDELVEKTILLVQEKDKPLPDLLKEKINDQFSYGSFAKKFYKLIEDKSLK